MPTLEIDGLKFGVNICWDANFASPAALVAEQGASLLLCPANNMLARPVTKAWKEKHNLVRGERCRDTGMWLMSADVVGSDEFCAAWGPTAVLNPIGEVVAQLAQDIPGLLVFDVPTNWPTVAAGHLSS